MGLKLEDFFQIIKRYLKERDMLSVLKKERLYNTIESDFKDSTYKDFIQDFVNCLNYAFTWALMEEGTKTMYRLSTIFPMFVYQNYKDKIVEGGNITEHEFKLIVQKTLESYIDDFGYDELKGQEWFIECLKFCKSLNNTKD